MTVASSGSDAGAVTLAFAAVPLAAPPADAAEACVRAVREITGGPARLCVPTRPIPVCAGDAVEGLEPAVRVPAFGGEAELWTAPGALGAAEREAVAERLEWLWGAQTERALREEEVDRLRFQLAALRQIAHTLAVVRGVEETERIVLDSAGEIFFAWWGALFHEEGGRYRRRAARSPRGETVPEDLPSSAVREAAPPGAPPRLLGPDDALSRHLPGDLGAVAPLDLGDGGAGLLVLGPRINEQVYDRHDLELLGALTDASVIALRNAELVDRLRTQALRDPLTGCRNRRGFDEVLAREMERARRHDRSMALVLLDIDHFKRVNDHYGHDAGDRALRSVADAVGRAFRVTDSVCRFGGEEFALVLSETDREEGVRVAERLRRIVSGLEAPLEVPCPLTASFGVAAFPADGDDADALLRAADQALYRAKREGRDRVATAGGGPRSTRRTPSKP